MTASSQITAQEEKFCRDYVRRPVGRYAARFAGYEPAEIVEAAHRLLARDDIQDRIATLRHQLAWRQCHDSDAMLAKLQSVYELALEEEQYYAAVRAVALQARIAVLIDDRGRGTQRRRERPVTWAWDGKPTEPAAAEPAAQMSMNADECEGFAVAPGLPPHPALSSRGEGSEKENDAKRAVSPLSTPGGGCSRQKADAGWGEAGVAGYGLPSSHRRMVSSTPSGLPSASLFQKRSTV